jgi:dTDP-4-dehydrorhamnose reductase
MQKVIIIGAKGMLGQEIVRVFSADPMWNVVGWDSENLDITIPQQVAVRLPAAEPSLVINCAAYNNVDGAETEPEKALLVNGTAVQNLAEACNGINATLVHFSTDYVFDGMKTEGYDEATEPNPQGAYAKSKFVGEQAAQKCSKHYVIRLSRLFGKPAQVENAKRSFVEVMLNLSKTKDKIEVVDAEYSSPTYAPDLAQATHDIIRLQSPFGIYHRTNNGACTWLEFAKEIFKQKKISVEVIPVSPEKFIRPAKRPQFSKLLTTKLPALRSWQDALQEFLSTL